MSFIKAAILAGALGTMSTISMFPAHAEDARSGFDVMSVIDNRAAQGASEPVASPEYFRCCCRCQ